MQRKHFSSNKFGLPLVVFKPGEIYHNTIIYKFSVQR